MYYINKQEFLLKGNTRPFKDNYLFHSRSAVFDFGMNCRSSIYKFLFSIETFILKSMGKSHFGAAFNCSFKLIFENKISCLIRYFFSLQFLVYKWCRSVQ